MEASHTEDPTSQNLVTENPVSLLPVICRRQSGVRCKAVPVTNEPDHPTLSGGRTSRDAIHLDRAATPLLHPPDWHNVLLSWQSLKQASRYELSWSPGTFWRSGD